MPISHSVRTVLTMMRANAVAVWGISVSPFPKGSATDTVMAKTIVTSPYREYGAALALALQLFTAEQGEILCRPSGSFVLSCTGEQKCGERSLKVLCVASAWLPERWEGSGLLSLSACSCRYRNQNSSLIGSTNQNHIGVYMTI